MLSIVILSGGAEIQMGDGEEGECLSRDSRSLMGCAVNETCDIASASSSDFNLFKDSESR